VHDLLFFRHRKFPLGSPANRGTPARYRDISKLNQLPDLTHESQIGLVFPIYAWGAPEPVVSFVKKLPKTKAFTFAVCTCFEEAGYAMKKLSDLYPFRSSYSLVMPNNYIISADVDDAQTIRKKI